MTNFEVEKEHWGKPCAVQSCIFVVGKGDEWGEHWTSDDNDNLYCADHNDQNVTSDNFVPYLDTLSGFVDHCGGCGGIVEGDDPFREFCDACDAD